MSSWSAPSRRSELSRALYDVARKPLDEVFRKRDRSDHADFKILAEAAEELEQNSWGKRHYNTALSEVIRRAIEKVPTDSPHRYSTMAWREIAATLCGFEHDDEAEQVETPRLYDRRYEVVKRRSKGLAGASAFKEEVIEPTWPKLADALASLMPTTNTPARQRNQTREWHRGKYVVRADLHSQYASVIANSTRVVVLVGQPGIGKTWAATELARTSSKTNVPRIRFVDGKPNLFDLQTALGLSGIEELILGDPLVYLARLCNGQTQADSVIFDNFGDAGELFAILPQEPKVTVIATARRKGRNTPTWAEYIAVQPMSQEEATSLVLRYIPALSKESAATLADNVANSPLIIPTICGLLQSSGTSIEIFCEDLEKSLRLLASDSYVEGDERLGVAYGFTWIRLGQRDPLAIKLFLLICHLHQHSIGIVTKRLLWYMLKFGGLPDLSFISFNREGVQDISILEFERALKTLSDFSLIDIDQNPVASNRLAGRMEFIHVHSLTRVMFVDFFGDRQLYVAASLLEALTWHGHYYLAEKGGFKDKSMEAEGFSVLWVGWVHLGIILSRFIDRDEKELEESMKRLGLSEILKGWKALLLNISSQLLSRDSLGHRGELVANRVLDLLNPRLAEWIESRGTAQVVERVVKESG